MVRIYSGTVVCQNKIVFQATQKEKKNRLEKLSVKDCFFVFLFVGINNQRRENKGTGKVSGTNR